MDIDQFEVARLFTIKKNQLKMVKRRGYNIDKEEDLLSITSNEFLEAYVPFAKKEKKTFRQILSRPYSNDKGENIVVYFADAPTNTSQLGVDVLSDAMYEIDKHKSKNAIIITPKSLSPAAKKKIEGFLTYNIYIFLENEMAYDPTEHYLTPEHKALSPEEQRDFLIRNNLSIDSMPLILTSDMISRYYGFRPGQVIQINRINLYDTIVQNSLSYRVVKEDDII